VRLTQPGIAGYQVLAGAGHAVVEVYRE